MSGNDTGRARSKVWPSNAQLLAVSPIFAAISETEIFPHGSFSE
jgi:hypothetical protein